MEELSPELRARVQLMLDVFTGADGGVSFMRFRWALARFETEAAQGLPAARELLKKVHEFGRLLEAVTKD